MRALIFCPLGPKPKGESREETPRLWGRALQSIFRLETDGEISYLFREGPNESAEKNENVLEQYQFARWAALDGEYDALLTVESDMILPADALFRLATHLENGAGIAYGLYVFRHGSRRWSAYTHLETTKGVSISEDPEAAKAAWGQTIEVAGVGMGCTLISREVLWKIEPRLMPGTPWIVAPDWMLALDVQRQGYRQVCDLGVVCGHMTYQPYPQIIWPDPQADHLYSVEVLPNVPVQVAQNGEKIEIRVGMGVNEIHRADKELVATLKVERLNHGQETGN